MRIQDAKRTKESTDFYVYIEIHLRFSRSTRFRSQLDALNIPVFLRVILDRTVRAKLAHLVVKFV